ncbi:MAG TPA: alpha/beta hydrolase-fold protein [Candidatus Methanomethylicus sp.]|nr:alpha/beta hydrolase-fold protein [Candidatus Methanomethylicus sp.]
MEIKKAIVALILLIIVAASATVLIQASPNSPAAQRTTGTVWYTETRVSLDGAMGVIRVPQGWNGSLVVLCRDYVAHSDFDPSAVPLDIESEMWLNRGVATAASNYGEGGMRIQRAMAATYQLTRYVAENYNVTGKVYLAGISMGGSVALLLGERYPDVYDGVLDVCGPKDYAEQYMTKILWASMSSTDIEEAFAVMDLTAPSDINAFRVALLQSANDIAAECGGSPDESPAAYQRISPRYNLDFQIPVIYIVTTHDSEVLVAQNYEFYIAVRDAGKGDLVHVSPTPLGHLDGNIIANLPSAFGALVHRVETGRWLPTVVCFLSC